VIFTCISRSVFSLRTVARSMVVIIGSRAGGEL
jgi:hypothetical protein